jgi:hypothetical protein
MSHLLDGLRQRFKVSSTAWDRELIAGVEKLEAIAVAAQARISELETLLHEADEATRLRADRVRELEVREARLRAALERIVKTDRWPELTPCETECPLCIARASLAAPRVEEPQPCPECEPFNKENP